MVRSIGSAREARCAGEHKNTDSGSIGCRCASSTAATDRTFLLRCMSPQLAPTGCSRQRDIMPAMEAKRTVGGRGLNRRSQALPEDRLERLRWFVLAPGDEHEAAAIHHPARRRGGGFAAQGASAVGGWPPPTRSRPSLRRRRAMSRRAANIVGKRSTCNKGEGVLRRHSEGRISGRLLLAYFARRYEVTTGPRSPTAVVLVYFSSSAVRVLMTRLPSNPSWFGSVLASSLSRRVLLGSSTV
jgi:hypothetical protein